MKYFFEASHSTHILGDIVIERLIGYNKNFGHVLNQSNVNQFLNKDKQNMIKYIKNNPNVIDWINENV